MKKLKNYTEQEVLVIIDKIVGILAPKFVFGAYDLSDIKQEGRIEAIKAINNDKYDETRPLDKFLYTHIRNRYINLRRDKFSRHEPPCNGCPFFDASSNSGCKEFNNKDNCELWNKWNKLNAGKRSLAKPNELATNEDGETFVHSNNRCIVEDCSEKELLKLVDLKLPIDMRKDLLKLKSGLKLSKDRTKEIYTKVKDILDDREEE